MTIHAFRATAKSAEVSPSNPGAAVVADLRRLPSVQALSVMFLRDWCSGSRASVSNALCEALGPQQGASTMAALDTLLGLLARDGRRPLCCHALHCLCVGADEAVIANLLHLAAMGEREDAMLIASLLLPADRAMIAVEAARVAGLGILRTNIRDKTISKPDTLH